MSDMHAKSAKALAIPRLGFGGGSAFGANADLESMKILHHAYEQGFRHFDTAPFYGHGLSEHRFGAALRLFPRDDFVLSTKVGRMLAPQRHPAHDSNKLPFEVRYDYSYEGVMRSFEDSLQRLGINRIDIAYIHDVSPKWHGAEYEKRFAEAIDGGYRALDELRSGGALAAIGVGVKDAEVCLRFAQAAHFDCFMLAGGYTLLEHASLDDFLPYCHKHGIDVIVASAFNSGILASGDVPGASYYYADAPASIRARTARLQAVCARHDVPLGAAALQFPLAHPGVAAVVSGYRSTTDIDTNLRWASMAIPAELWAELKAEGQLPAHAPVPEGPA